MAERKAPKKWRQQRSKEFENWTKMLELRDRVLQKSPVAWTRKFPTPVYEGKLPSGVYGAAEVDLNSPTNSRITVPRELRSFRGNNAMRGYENMSAGPMRHELIHVLQNLDADPFENAMWKMREPITNNYERMRWEQHNPRYGDTDTEAQAFLLSRTQGVNDVLRENLGMEKPEYQKPPQLLDRMLPAAFNRNYLTEQFRGDYLKNFPEGLRKIIEDVVGPPKR